jgi:hypothetical protein
MAFTVNLKVLSGFGNRKDFCEFVRTHYLVSFAGAKSRRNILDALRSKNNRLTVSAGTGHHKLIYKTLDVELPEHEFLSGFVETHHAPVLMNLSLWILWLRVGAFLFGVMLVFFESLEK